MREILFRGKRTHCLDDKWVEGFLGEHQEWNGKKSSVIYNGEHTLDGSGFGMGQEFGFRPKYSYVDSDTVGQYTGLTDKNGKKIFEGDIVKTHYANAAKADFVEVVVFHNGRFCAEGNIDGCGKSWACLWDGVRHAAFDNYVYMDSVEVIGNVYDNKELLNED